ncbi:TlpA family protein disulfide reductase [Sphingobacterium sp. LRF_L2]|uniref:TlpA family protein disulfide reductase n=1 Tax=Sphingobacterium sp. LRF_L2 TaxID=3369421 RepID=UPI003F640484
MNSNILKFFASVLLLFSILQVSAQLSDDFVVGDPAPPIRYSKWLKGTPVENYEKGHIYVIECWATWCGPCIAAMPHLSELAKKI